MDVNVLKENLRIVERSIARLKYSIAAYEKYTSDCDYWERSMFYWSKDVTRQAAFLIPTGCNEDWA